MHKSLQAHHLRANHAREVTAGLASFLAFALDLTDLKAAPDELAQVDAADYDLASRVARVEGDTVLRVLAFYRLGLDQGDVARVRVVEMAIPLEAAARMRSDGLNRVCRLAVLRRKKDRLDST